MSRHGIVSAEAAQDLRAARRALDRAPTELRRLIEDTSRSQLSEAWTQEISAGGGSRAQQKFVGGGAHVLPMSAGLIARTGDDPILTKPYEFGTIGREEFVEYERKNLVNNGTHTVRRRTKRQLPEHNAGGWLAFPAANRLGSRVFKMWGALINKVTHDAFEGKG